MNDYCFSSGKNYVPHGLAHTSHQAGTMRSSMTACIDIRIGNK